MNQYRREKLKHRREFRKLIGESFGYLVEDFGFKCKWVNIDAVYARSPEIAVQFTKRNRDGITVGVAILAGDGPAYLSIFYSDKSMTLQKSMHFDAALFMLKLEKPPEKTRLDFSAEVLRKYCVDFLKGDHNLLDKIDSYVDRRSANIERRFVRTVDSVFQFLLEEYGFEKLPIIGLHQNEIPLQIIYCKGTIGLAFHGGSEDIYCTLFNGTLTDGEFNEDVDRTSIRTVLTFRCPTVHLPVGVDGQVILLPQKPLTARQVRDGLEFCAKMLREHCRDFLEGDPSLIPASNHFERVLYGQA